MERRRDHRGIRLKSAGPTERRRGREGLHWAQMHCQSRQSSVPARWPAHGLMLLSAGGGGDSTWSRCVEKWRLIGLPARWRGWATPPNALLTASWPAPPRRAPAAPGTDIPATRRLRPATSSRLRRCSWARLAGARGLMDRRRRSSHAAGGRSCSARVPLEGRLAYRAPRGESGVAVGIHRIHQGTKCCQRIVWAHERGLALRERSAWPGTRSISVKLPSSRNSTWRLLGGTLPKSSSSRLGCFMRTR